MRSLLFALTVIPQPVLADVPLNEDTFRAHTEGRSFDFTYGGPPYGTEHYLSNGQVIWVENDGACFEGKWYQSGETICFRYRGIWHLTCSVFYAQGEDMRVVPNSYDDPAHSAVLANGTPSISCEAPLS